MIYDHSLTIPVVDNATDVNSTIVKSVLLAGILHFSPLERLEFQETTVLALEGRLLLLEK